MQASPQLQIEAPPEFAAIRSRLESLSPQRFADIVQLLKLTDAGPVIRVVLAGENSELSRQVSPWIAGFAIGASDLVVVFSARSSGYPHHTFGDLVRLGVGPLLI